MKRTLNKILKSYFRDERATALVEAALFFPVMFTLLMGIFDIGNGIILNQKTITSSQIAADLLAA